MSRLRPFARALSLSSAERAFVARAIAWSPVLALSLRAVGLKTTLQWISALPMGRSLPRALAVAPERAGALIERLSARHLIIGKCLPQSTLQFLLHQLDGTPATLVVGVRRVGERLEAHAWVEPTTDARTENFSEEFRLGTTQP